MIERVSPMEIQVEAEFSLDRFIGSECIQSISFSTQRSGVLHIASKGQLPSLSFGQLRTSLDQIKTFAAITDRRVLIDHNGLQLATIAKSNEGSPKLSVRWWTLGKQVLRSRWKR